MVILLAAFLAQATSSEIESLVRDLGADLIEVRERAHRRLLEVGEKALPTLLFAANSSDIELRTRAASIAGKIEREARERPHDAAEKATLLHLTRDQKAEGRPGSGATEGSRFDLSATAFDGGWIVHTSFVDYLARRKDEGAGRGRLGFDVASITGSDGRELAVERCGSCSPRLVFVRGNSEIAKVSIQGSQTWFSRYPLVFENPAEGQVKQVGDFTIHVTGLELTVTSAHEFPYEWIRSMSGPWTAEIKPDLFLAGGRFTGRSGRAIGCGGRRAVEEKRHWCNCPLGPRPMTSRTAPLVRSFLVANPSYTGEGKFEMEKTVDFPPLLEHVARITYEFWKPLEIPIDLQIDVPLR